MKIAIIDEVHEHRIKSGIGRYTFELFRNLKDIEENVDLLALTHEEEGNYSEQGIKLLNPGINLPFFRRTFNWQLYYPKIIPDNYDVYHTTNPFLIKTVAGKYNSIVTIHDMGLFELPEHRFLKSCSPYNFFSYIHRKVLKDNILSVKKIITISDYTREKIIEILGVKEGDIEVIYHGVSPAFKPMDKEECRKKLNIDEDKKVILYVGTEHPKKNVGTLIKSVYEIKKEIKDILLARAGVCSNSSRHKINKLKLGNNVKYFDNLGDSELPLLYNAADVFVFPSVYEGFGMPLLEAMACNVPVIAANATCFPEIVKDAGILFDPLNTEELSKALIRVLGDKEISDDLIQKGSRRVRNFSWKETAEKTLKVYREVYE